MTKISIEIVEWDEMRKSKWSEQNIISDFLDPRKSNYLDTISNTCLLEIPASQNEFWMEMVRFSPAKVNNMVSQDWISLFGIGMSSILRYIDYNSNGWKNQWKTFWKECGNHLYDCNGNDVDWGSFHHNCFQYKAVIPPLLSCRIFWQVE